MQEHNLLTMRSREPQSMTARVAIEGQDLFLNFFVPQLTGYCRIILYRQEENGADIIIGASRGVVSVLNAGLKQTLCAESG